jgi:N-acetylglucosamine-6-phosphate deacetylase
VGLRLHGLVLRGRRLAPGEVAIGDGRLAPAGAAGDLRRLPEGWVVAPGLVDLQVNGYAGAEVGDDPDEIAAVAAALPATGVTAFCPTLVSRSEAAYRRAAVAIGRVRWPAAGARALGVHLEGPFLAPSRAGAHPVDALREPSPEALARLLGDFAPAIVTLAPELPGGLEAIRRVTAAGAVAAVGHTEADSSQGRAAIAAGARLATHAMNAMRGIERRDPSALVAFLSDSRARVSLIGDGVHVAPEVAGVLARAAGGRLVLVSDAIAAAGMPPGRYPLGGRDVESDGLMAVRDGRLAGAVAGLDRGPRTLVVAGIGRAAALAAATAAPRRLLGLAPGLAAGAPADLVVLDPDLVPRLTLVGGAVAHADPALPFDVPDPGAPV